MKLVYKVPPEIGGKGVGSSIQCLSSYPQNSIYQKPAGQEPVAVNPVGQTKVGQGRERLPRQQAMPKHPGNLRDEQPHVFSALSEIQSQNWSLVSAFLLSWGKWVLGWYNWEETQEACLVWVTSLISLGCMFCTLYFSSAKLLLPVCNGLVTQLPITVSSSA